MGARTVVIWVEILVGLICDPSMVRGVLAIDFDEATDGAKVRRGD